MASLEARIADVIRTFSYDDYDMKEVAAQIRDFPDDQEWIGHLAKSVLAMVEVYLAPEPTEAEAGRRAMEALGAHPEE